MTAVTGPALECPALRSDIRTDDRFVDARGTAHRVVQDWVGRGRGHYGFVFGRHAAGILDLLDGRPIDCFVEEARARLGGGFGPREADKLIAGLEDKRLLDTDLTRSWLAGLHGAALAGGKRPALLAGTDWYPSELAALGAIIADLLERARGVRGRTGAGGVRAIVVPHAGFQSSGGCAAKAFAELAGIDPPRTVILLGPNHCYRRNEVDVGTLPFETPLGRLEADVGLARDLAQEAPNSTHDGLAQFREHSLEMELPFLQVLARDHWRSVPTIVPIILSQRYRDGTFRPDAEQLDMLDRLAAALARALADPEILLVVSGDLTHYGPMFGFTPFDDSIAEQIEAHDREALAAFGALDVDRFRRLLGRRNWCGGPSFYVLILVARALGLEPDFVEYLLHPEDLWLDGQHTTTFASFSFVAGARPRHGESRPTRRPPDSSGIDSNLRRRSEERGT